VYASCTGTGQACNSSDQCYYPAASFTSQQHFNYGDHYTFTVTGGAPNATVAAHRVRNGIDQGTVGYIITDGNGNASFTSSWVFTTADWGAWTAQFTVGGTPISWPSTASYFVGPSPPGTPAMSWPASAALACVMVFAGVWMTGRRRRSSR
jgi:hypothetical protein